MQDKRDLEVGDTVKLRPKGLPGKVKRIPRQQPGEPPLAVVDWEAGNTGTHDRRDLILVEDKDV
jgi:hypothetical protein